eukprot:scpid74436/ scgid26502/ 
MDLLLPRTWICRVLLCLTIFSFAGSSTPVLQGGSPALHDSDDARPGVQDPPPQPPLIGSKQSTSGATDNDGPEPTNVERDARPVHMNMASENDHRDTVSVENLSQVGQGVVAEDGLGNKFNQGPEELTSDEEDSPRVEKTTSSERPSSGENKTAVRQAISHTTTRLGGKPTVAPAATTAAGAVAAPTAAKELHLLAAGLKQGKLSPSPAAIVPSPNPASAVVNGKRAGNSAPHEEKSSSSSVTDNVSSAPVPRMNGSQYTPPLSENAPGQRPSQPETRRLNSEEQPDEYSRKPFNRRPATSGGSRLAPGYGGGSQGQGFQNSRDGAGYNLPQRPYQQERRGQPQGAAYGRNDAQSFRDGRPSYSNRDYGKRRGNLGNGSYRTTQQLRGNVDPAYDAERYVYTPDQGSRARQPGFPRDGTRRYPAGQNNPLKTGDTSRYPVDQANLRPRTGDSQRNPLGQNYPPQWTGDSQRNPIGQNYPPQRTGDSQRYPIGQNYPDTSSRNPVVADDQRRPFNPPANVGPKNGQQDSLDHSEDRGPVPSLLNTQVKTDRTLAGNSHEQQQLQQDQQNPSTVQSLSTTPVQQKLSSNTNVTRNAGGQPSDNLPRPSTPPPSPALLKTVAAATTAQPAETSSPRPSTAPATTMQQSPVLTSANKDLPLDLSTTAEIPATTQQRPGDSDSSSVLQLPKVDAVLPKSSQDKPFVERPPANVPPMVPHSADVGDKKPSVVFGKTRPGGEEPAKSTGYSTHFVMFFLAVCVISVLVYAARNNKNKVLAFVMDGSRRSRRGAGGRYERVPKGDAESAPSLDSAKSASYVY